MQATLNLQIDVGEADERAALITGWRRIRGVAGRRLTLGRC